MNILVTHSQASNSTTSSNLWISNSSSQQESTNLLQPSFISSTESSSPLANNDSTSVILPTAVPISTAAREVFSSLPSASYTELQLCSFETPQLSSRSERVSTDNKEKSKNCQISKETSKF